jgi:hypothetical protein
MKSRKGRKLKVALALGEQKMLTTQNRSNYARKWVRRYGKRTGWG